MLFVNRFFLRPGALLLAAFLPCVSWQAHGEGEKGCRQGNDIHDRSRWGVTGTNFMKDILLEDSNFKGMLFFGNSTGKFTDKSPFPYRLTERIEIKSLKTASGVEPRVSTDPELLKAVKVIR